jgi:hypothetical protein
VALPRGATTYGWEREPQPAKGPHVVCQERDGARAHGGGGPQAAGRWSGRRCEAVPVAGQVAGTGDAALQRGARADSGVCAQQSPAVDAGALRNPSGGGAAVLDNGCGWPWRFGVGARVRRKTSFSTSVLLFVISMFI